MSSFLTICNFNGFLTVHHSVELKFTTKSALNRCNVWQHTVVRIPDTANIQCPPEDEHVMLETCRGS
jgi:hypothetical protein